MLKEGAQEQELRHQRFTAARRCAVFNVNRSQCQPFALSTMRRAERDWRINVLEIEWHDVYSNSTYSWSGMMFITAAALKVRVG